MSVISLKDRLITLKIVYYGPASGGKTTSLQYIHRVLDPDKEVRLVTLSTAGDSTLFFDFLPIDLGKIGRFGLRVQGFTVPGQTRYSRTRRYVLSGADAVVFVANSDPAAREENRESIADFRENLRANGLDPDRIPFLIQYNKRDVAGARSLEDLRGDIRFREAPEYETTAIQGDGVFEAFRDAVGRMVEKVAREASLDGPTTSEAVRGRLDSIRTAALAAPERTDEPEVVSARFSEEAPSSGEHGEQLLEKALGSGVELSRLYAEVNVARRRLEVAVGYANVLNRLGRRLLAASSTEEIWKELFRACRESVPGTGASLLGRPGEGRALRAVAVEGYPADPFLNGLGADAEKFLRHLGEPAHVTERDAPDLVRMIRDVEPGVAGVLLVPVSVRGDVEGAVVLYRTGRESPFHLRETRLLSSVANLVSLALGRALREQEFVLLTRELEDRVRDRTERLTSALRTIRRLNETLERRVKVRTSELEQANETLRRTQDFLLQAEKMSSLARMAAGIAHEINNPMAYVQGNLKTLRSYAREIDETFVRIERGLESGSPEDALSAVRVVLGNPGIREVREDLQSLVDESADGALRVVKIAEGMRNLAYLRTSHRVEVDLVPQIENALTVLEHRLKHGVQVVREYGPLPPLTGQATLLSQLFLNLIVNALDAMEDRGRLTIRTFTEEGAGVVEVEDTGPGIPEEVRAHVFEPFFTTKEVGKGTGLGLYTVYQIVERHGGVVSIDSEPGRGTVFRIQLLPSATPAPVGAEEEP